jgi:hypothetical protein
MATTTTLRTLADVKAKALTLAGACREAAAGLDELAAAVAEAETTGVVPADLPQRLLASVSKIADAVVALQPSTPFIPAPGSTVH